MRIDNIVNNKIKRCDKSATNDYIVITSDTATVEKVYLISSENTSIVITEFIREATLPLWRYRT